MRTASSRSIVIVGSSGHAKVVIDVIEREGTYRIAGLIDSFKPRGEPAFGYEVLGSEDDLPTLLPCHDLSGCFIALGDNWQRHLLARKIVQLLPELAFISTAHPSAHIARGVTIGRGTVLMAGAVVNSDSTVGDFCIINTNASLDHDCVMEDYSSLAPNAAIGGNTHIGAFSAVGLGASVVHKRTIGRHAVIGAGSVVVGDVPEFSVAYGVPSRVVRRRAEGDNYL